LRYVGDHDLYVPAAVLMCPGRETGAGDLGQVWRDLDPYNPAKRPPGRLMHHPTFSTSEVHEGVAVRDADVAKRSGEPMPGRWHVVHSIVTQVFVQLDGPRSVEPPVQEAVCEPLQTEICDPRAARKPISQAPTPHRQPDSQSSAARACIQQSLLFRPAPQLLPLSCGVVG
jgi:hypothetical protein